MRSYPQNPLPIGKMISHSRAYGFVLTLVSGVLSGFVHSSELLRSPAPEGEFHRVSELTEKIIQDTPFQEIKSLDLLETVMIAEELEFESAFRFRVVGSSKKNFAILASNRFGGRDWLYSPEFQVSVPVLPTGPDGDFLASSMLRFLEGGLEKGYDDLAFQMFIALPCPQALKLDFRNDPRERLEVDRLLAPYVGFHAKGHEYTVRAVEVVLSHPDSVVRRLAAIGLAFALSWRADGEEVDVVREILRADEVIDSMKTRTGEEAAALRQLQRAAGL